MLKAINDSVQHPGVHRALRAPVLAAKHSSDRRDGGGAIQQLNAFEDAVRAQTEKNLSASDAERLISLADSILARL
jgi:hypothetical protein